MRLSARPFEYRCCARSHVRQMQQPLATRCRCRYLLRWRPVQRASFHARMYLRRLLPTRCRLRYLRHSPRVPLRLNLSPMLPPATQWLGRLLISCSQPRTPPIAALHPCLPSLRLRPLVSASPTPTPSPLLTLPPSASPTSTPSPRNPARRILPISALLPQLHRSRVSSRRTRMATHCSHRPRAAARRFHPLRAPATPSLITPATARSPLPAKVMPHPPSCPRQQPGERSHRRSRRCLSRRVTCRSRAPRTSRSPPAVRVVPRPPRCPRRWTGKRSRRWGQCSLPRRATRCRSRASRAACSPLVASALARSPPMVRATPPSPGRPRQCMGERSRRATRCSLPLHAPTAPSLIALAMARSPPTVKAIPHHPLRALTLPSLVALVTARSPPAPVVVLHPPSCPRR